METDERFKTLKILFVDDDDLIRNSMAYYFRNRVALFAVFESAEEALEALEKEKIDIAICDYRLSGMDGIGFFEKLAENYPEIKQVLITAYTTEDIEEKAQSIGVDAFVAKPFDSENIMSVLMKVLEKSG